MNDATQEMIERMEKAIIGHRNNLEELQYSIRIRASETPETPETDEQRWELLRQLDHLIGRARGRLMEIKAFKEAKNLAQHLKEKHGWRSPRDLPTGEYASDGINTQTILLATTSSPNPKLGWYMENEDPERCKWYLTGVVGALDDGEVLAWRPLPRYEKPV